MSTSVLKEKSDVKKAELFLRGRFEKPSQLRTEVKKEDEAVALMENHKYVWELVADRLGVDKTQSKPPFVWTHGTPGALVHGKIAEELKLQRPDSTVFFVDSFGAGSDPMYKTYISTDEYNAAIYLQSDSLILGGIIPPDKNLNKGENIVDYIRLLFLNELIKSDSLWLNILVEDQVGAGIRDLLDLVAIAHAYGLANHFGHKRSKPIEQYIKLIPQDVDIGTNPARLAAEYIIQTTLNTGQRSFDDAERQLLRGRFAKILQNRSRSLEESIEIMVKNFDGSWSSRTFIPQD